MSMHLTSKDYEKRKKQLGYKGCKNCVHQIESLRMCEIWGTIKDNDRAKVCTTFLQKAELKGGEQ